MSSPSLELYRSGNSIWLSYWDYRGGDDVHFEFMANGQVFKETCEDYDTSSRAEVTESLPNEIELLMKYIERDIS